MKQGLACALLALLTGCGASPNGELRLAEPHDGDPKATIELRIVHATTPGDHWDDVASYDNETVSAGVHPVFAQPAIVHFATTFWHEEKHYEERLVPVTKYRSVTKTVRDSCASTDSHGHCQSGTTTRREDEAYTSSEMQTVLITTKIPDGECKSFVKPGLESGHRYRITFTFLADKRCEILCADEVNGAPCATLAAADAIPPPPRERKVQHPLHNVGIAVGAVGAVGLLGWAATGIAASAQKPTIHEHCDANQVCDAEGFAAAQTGKDWATRSAAFLVGGGALVAAGAILFTLPSTWMRVQVGAGGPGSLVLRGTF